MLSVPGSKVVRGFSIYRPRWSTSSSRLHRHLLGARQGPRVTDFPATGCRRGRAQLGPDATGLGWVYQYVLTGLVLPDHRMASGTMPEDRWHAQPEEADADRGRTSSRSVPSTSRKCPLDGWPPLRESRPRAASQPAGRDLRYELTASTEFQLPRSEGSSSSTGHHRPRAPARLPHRPQGHCDGHREVEHRRGRSVIEMAENEYMVRSRGYLRGLEDWAR